MTKTAKKADLDTIEERLAEGGRRASFAIHLNDAEKEILSKIAGIKGLPVAVYIRSVAVEKARAELGIE